MNLPQSKPRVGFFVTCLVDAMRPNIGFAAVKLLRAAAVQMTVDQLPVNSNIPQAAANYIANYTESVEDANLDISPELSGYNWSGFQNKKIGRARPESQCSVTACIAAVAETASIVLASDPGHPSTLGLLPDCHIVVFKKSQICAYLEDVWPIIRNCKNLPRVININTGSSRKGDIEQTIEVGAHGPRKMHIVLLS